MTTEELLRAYCDAAGSKGCARDVRRRCDDDAARGKIVSSHEVANIAPAFFDMNFAPERIARIHARQGAALKARPEMRRHLA